MRETVRSLRAYFILSALVGGAVNVAALLREGTSALGLVIGLIGLGFAIAYLYAGLRLPRLLATAPHRVTGLLIAAAVFLALLFGLDLAAGIPGRTLPTVIIGLLLTWYLFANVRRLSKASATQASAVSPG
jgi:hypothetical protein